jgi:hypothetical protein
MTPEKLMKIISICDIHDLVGGWVGSADKRLKVDVRIFSNKMAYARFLAFVSAGGTRRLHAR